MHVAGPSAETCRHLSTAKRVRRGRVECVGRETALGAFSGGRSSRGSGRVGGGPKGRSIKHGRFTTSTTHALSVASAGAVAVGRADHVGSVGFWVGSVATETLVAALSRGVFVSNGFTVGYAHVVGHGVGAKDGVAENTSTVDVLETTDKTSRAG